MGVAELIPGISGATVAVIFKIYPNLMKILSNLRIKNLTLNFSQAIAKLLVPIMFKRILLVGFLSCTSKGLDKPAYIAETLSLFIT